MPDGPQTRASLAADLTSLGVRPGDTVLVHSSLRSLGWVCGGAVAVVQALRSNHPHASFAAVGSAAAALMAEHRLDSHLGEHSPLAALERVGARVLLLGVGYESCTAFHLAEYRVPTARTEYGAAVLTGDGGRRWLTYTDVVTNSDDFDRLGAAFDGTGAPVRGQVGPAECRLFPVDKTIAFAVGWMAANRSG